MSRLRAKPLKTGDASRTAPPVMRRGAAPADRAAAAPIASLAAIPATPAVQRKCAACDRDDSETAVQPRLEVGPVGDRHEREADSIAARVMAMRSADTAPAVSPSPAGPRARRDGGGESIAASDAQLTSGGSELPAATRDFFESRMGRDLGDVRVHQGGDAAAKNDSISARAFTYKNHVWLGAGERAAPGFTMAHELAHVMQQTAPGPVGSRVQRSGSGEVRVAEGLRQDKDAEEARRKQEATDRAAAGKEPAVVNLANRVLTDDDIVKAEAGAKSVNGKSPGRVTPIIWQAQFVLHDTAGVFGTSETGRRVGLGRRSAGEGPAAYVPRAGDAQIAHDPMFGPRRPTATQYEKGGDLMSDKDRNAGMRAIWSAVARDIGESTLDAVLSAQGSDAKEAKSEKAKAIKTLEAKKGIVSSAGAWAVEDICNKLTPANAKSLSKDPAKPADLTDACKAMSSLFIQRGLRIGSNTNLEILQDPAPNCEATGTLTPLAPYTADQYTGAAAVYLRAALEARVFPKITTHFLVDKGAGDHCDPHCFDIGRLYATIAALMGHATGTIYGITPVYGIGASANAWWNDTVCGGGHP